MFPSTSLARAVVDGLLLAGVRHAVLSPGSRSAPLAYELQEADRAGLLELHVRVDERAAAFLALGLAKLTRAPAAVVTTSGTAVANLHPAVLEAHHALVPLLVLSADRPVELRGIGANQTTMQPGIFGPVMRAQAELDPDDGAAADWTATVEELVVRARGAATTGEAVTAWPGPVHLDLAFREPLVPDLAETEGRTWPGSDVRSEPEQPVTPRIRATAPPLRLPDRTFVVIGDLPEPHQAARLARWAGDQGLPVVAEPFGGQPLGPTSVAHGPLLLGTTWFEAQRPQHVVVAGRVTLSRPVRQVLTSEPARVTYLRAGPRWLGPSFDVGRTLDLDPVLAAPAPAAGRGRRDWLRRWREAARTVSSAVAAECVWGSGPAVARALASALPEGSRLVVGSSNAVRDLELGVDWAALPGPAGGAREVRTDGSGRGVHVVANRGLAGIDGVVSTAAGVALAGGGATYALVGDLTFLHDVGALLVGPLERRPDLTIVVVNDDGGGIFATLEPGEPERAADFERIFGTPTAARIEDLTRAYSVGYARATSAAELAAEVARVPVGLRVVEVTLDRGGHRALREALRAAAERVTAPLHRDVHPGPPGPGRPDRDYPERGMRS